MLLSFGLNFVCRFASQGSFPITCYNSSQRIFVSVFFNLWHFKIRKKFLNLKKNNIRKIRILKFSIYDRRHHHYHYIAVVIVGLLYIYRPIIDILILLISADTYMDILASCACTSV